MRTLTLRSVAATLAAFMVGFSAAAIADKDRNDGDKDDKFAARLSGLSCAHAGVDEIVVRVKKTLEQPFLV